LSTPIVSTFIRGFIVMSDVWWMPLFDKVVTKNNEAAHILVIIF
jgi:hypothetical protein